MNTVSIQSFPLALLGLFVNFLLRGFNSARAAKAIGFAKPDAEGAGQALMQDSRLAQMLETANLQIETERAMLLEAAAACRELLSDKSLPPRERLKAIALALRTQAQLSRLPRAVTVPGIATTTTHAAVPAAKPEPKPAAPAPIAAPASITKAPESKQPETQQPAVPLYQSHNPCADNYIDPMCLNHEGRIAPQYYSSFTVELRRQHNQQCDARLGVAR